ncbi:lipid IV(A) palmitoyltransferase PagP [Pantoea sp. FN060301]|uniref:lipid IV(A) palmitoyltransferase PagP n=1 Tax=Pantoea sp. FN060301 TaxID=3420380 RepID=UPI003D1736AF
MKLTFTLPITLFLLLFTAAGTAQSMTLGEGISNTWQSFSGKVAITWNDPQHYDLYVPAITWHNRATYDREHINKYNERPWGAGGGISRYDDKGNWNGLYVMAFKDSFNKWEPFGGYGWEKIWRPLDDDNFRLGLGYTAGITARDNWKYIPVPAVLPLASIGYSKATFQMTYIPGTHNNGNVYFAWFRWQF